MKFSRLVFLAGCIGEEKKRKDDGSMYCKASVQIHANEGEHSIGFGQGIVMLLERVEVYGSINQATHDMGMAYSKAWKLIKAAESELGVSLLEREGHNCSVLTWEGKQLVALHKEALRAAQEAADAVLQSWTPLLNGQDSNRP